MNPFKNVYFHVNRFPGVWFDFEYIDRTKEECCRVKAVELTICTFYFSIELYPKQSEDNK